MESKAESDTSDGDEKLNGEEERPSKRRSTDPFQSSLRCQPLPDNAAKKITVLWWHSPEPCVPLRAEEALLPVLLRWNETERGMMKDQPGFRLHHIQRACRKERVPLLTALSLRRHHIKRLNPAKTMAALRLGSNDDIRRSATLFEEAVENALRSRKIPIWSEDEQKAHIRANRKKDEPYPPTPDFILKEPIVIKSYVDDRNNRNKGKRNRHRRVLSERVVHWIEVKMFYGASTIEHDDKSAVGCLMSTAQKYVRVHGDGAMLFLYGVGDRLVSQLAEFGVLALDCSSDRNGIDLAALQEHQRTWCADEDGNILI